MRARLILGINLVVGAGLLGWVLRGYGAPALEILAADRSIPLLAVFVAAVGTTVVGLSWRWRIVLAGLDRPLPLPLLTLYRSAAHSLAVLVPSGKVGGDPLRAWLAMRGGVTPGDAIASVAVDRTLEIATAAPFSVLFATMLVQHGVPGLGRVLVTVIVFMLGLALGVAIAVRRLRAGAGLVTALVRGAGLDRFRLVDAQMDVLAASEDAARRLSLQPRRMLGAFAVGLTANVLVIVEFVLLFAAFGLPLNPIAIVAAIFATGAAHMLPVPAAIGVLEGALVWIFQLLGYPTHVGLAVGLAVRLREFIWLAPGLLYLLGRSVRASLARLRTA